MKLEYSRRAEIDVIQAWTYYESEQDGLGARFLEALEQLLEKVVRNPQHYSFIVQTAMLRDVVLTPFPYIIVFEIAGDAVLPHRIFNTFQDSHSL